MNHDHEIRQPAPAATITFVSLAVSGLTSIPQLPVPLLPPSFTPNLTTVILSAINSLSLSYPVSSSSRTLLLVLSLKFLSPAISVVSMWVYCPVTLIGRKHSRNHAHWTVIGPDPLQRNLHIRSRRDWYMPIRTAQQRNAGDQNVTPISTVKITNGHHSRLRVGVSSCPKRPIQKRVPGYARIN